MTFLNVNPKTRLLNIHKFFKGPRTNQKIQKEIVSSLVIHLLIYLVIKIFCDELVLIDVFERKKYCL